MPAEPLLVSASPTADQMDALRAKLAETPRDVLIFTEIEPPRHSLALCGANFAAELPPGLWVAVEVEDATNPQVDGLLVNYVPGWPNAAHNVWHVRLRLAGVTGNSACLGRQAKCADVVAFANSLDAADG